jgi:hypothetical protein
MASEMFDEDDEYNGNPQQAADEKLLKEAQNQDKKSEKPTK